jgi:hypothetical protein
MSTYSPNLEPLLTLGDVDFEYLANGITAEHVPELIRMVTDEVLLNGEGPENGLWAPLHAWRALGQLRAEAAIFPLLSLLRRIDEEEDDSITIELPVVFGQIGPPAIAPLTAYLANPDNLPYARTAAADSLRAIGREHPSERTACIKVLVEHLERAGEHDPTLNGFVVSDLIDLSAIEALPVVQAAYEAQFVDETIVGGWEEARRLLDPSIGPPLHSLANPLEPQVVHIFDQAPDDLEPDWIDVPPLIQPGTPPRFVDLKAINKAAKQARSKAKKAKKNKARKK